MSNEHPALKMCRKDLEMFRKRQHDLESGALKFGESVDGRTWRDTTAEDIAFAKAKIDELTAVLSAKTD